MNMEDRDYESEARQQGWKPQEEFSGPEDKWTDAQTFVEKGDKIAGILKSRVGRLESEINELKNSNKEFGEYQNKLREKEREKNVQLLAQLETLRAEAINEMNGSEFTRIDQQMHSLREDMARPPQQQAPQSDPVAEAWLANNQWYNENQTLRTYADGLVAQVEAEGYTGKAYFNEISRRVKETFPKEFSNPKRSGSNSVESGGTIDTSDPKARTYANLDPEGKAACDRFVASGLTTKEEYVKTYDWD